MSDTSNLLSPFLAANSMMEMWKYFIDAGQRAVQSWNLVPKGGDTKMDDYPRPFLAPITLTQAWDYLIDAGQRMILFLDVSRENAETLSRRCQTSVQLTLKLAQ
jgi:hypothetical protein